MGLERAAGVAPWASSGPTPCSARTRTMAEPVETAVESRTDTPNSVRDALARVTDLLRQHRLVEGLVLEQLEQPPAEAHAELAQSTVYKKSTAALQRELDRLHPADIAFILEALPPDERMYIWHRVRAS